MATLTPVVFTIDLEKAGPKGGRTRAAPWAARITSELTGRERTQQDRSAARYHYSGKGEGGSKDIENLGSHIENLRAQGRPFELEVNTDFSDPEKNPLAALHEDHGGPDAVSRLPDEDDDDYHRRLLTQYVNATHGSNYEPEHFDSSNTEGGEATNAEEVRRHKLDNAVPVAGEAYGGPAAERAFPARSGESPEAHAARAIESHKTYIEKLRELAHASNKSQTQLDKRHVKALADSLGMAPHEATSRTGRPTLRNAHESPVVHLIESGLWPYKKRGADGVLYNHFNPTKHEKGGRSPRSEWAKQQLLLEMMPHTLDAMSAAQRDPRIVGQAAQQYLPSPARYRKHIDTAMGREGERKGQPASLAKLYAYGGGDDPHFNTLMDNVLEGLGHITDRAEDFGTGTRRGADTHFQAAIEHQLKHKFIDAAVDRAMEAQNSLDRNFGASSGDDEGASGDDVEPNKDDKITGKFLPLDEEAAMRDGFRHLMDIMGVNLRDPKTVLPYLAHLHKERLLPDVFGSVGPRSVLAGQPVIRGGRQEVAPDTTELGRSPYEVSEAKAKYDAVRRQHREIGDKLRDLQLKGPATSERGNISVRDSKGRVVHTSFDPRDKSWKQPSVNVTPADDTPPEVRAARPDLSNARSAPLEFATSAAWEKRLPSGEVLRIGHPDEIAKLTHYGDLLEQHRSAYEQEKKQKADAKAAATDAEVKRLTAEHEAATKVHDDSHLPKQKRISEVLERLEARLVQLPPERSALAQKVKDKIVEIKRAQKEQKSAYLKTKAARDTAHEKALADARSSVSLEPTSHEQEMAALQDTENAQAVTENRSPRKLFNGVADYLHHRATEDWKKRFGEVEPATDRLSAPEEEQRLLAEYQRLSPQVQSAKEEYERGRRDLTRRPGGALSTADIDNTRSRPVVDYLNEAPETKAELAARYRGRDPVISGTAEALRVLDPNNSSLLEDRVRSRYKKLYDQKFNGTLNRLNREYDEDHRSLLFDLEDAKSVERRAEANVASGKKNGVAASTQSGFEQSHAAAVAKRKAIEAKLASSKFAGFPSSRRRGPSSDTSVGPRADIVEGSFDDKLHDLAIAEMEKEHPADAKGHRESLWKEAHRSVLDDAEKHLGVTPEMAHAASLRREHAEQERRVEALVGRLKAAGAINESESTLLSPSFHTEGLHRLSMTDPTGTLTPQAKEMRQALDAEVVRLGDLRTRYSQARKRLNDTQLSRLDAPAASEDTSPSDVGLDENATNAFDKVAHVYNTHVLPTAAALVHRGDDEQSHALRRDFIRHHSLRQPAEEREFRAHEAVQRAVANKEDPIAAEKAARASVDPVSHKIDAARGWFAEGLRRLRPLVEKVKLAKEYEGSSARLAAQRKEQELRAAEIKLLADPKISKEQIAKIREARKQRANEQLASGKKTSGGYSPRNPYAGDAERWEAIKDSVNGFRRVAGGGATSISTPQGLFAPLETASVDNPHPADPVGHHFSPKTNLPAGHLVPFHEFHANAHHYERMHPQAFEAADQKTGAWNATLGAVRALQDHVRTKATSHGLTDHDLLQHSTKLPNVTPAKAGVVNAYQQTAKLHHQLLADHNRARAAHAHQHLIVEALNAGDKSVPAKAMEDAVYHKGSAETALDAHRKTAAAIANKVGGNNPQLKQRMIAEAKSEAAAAEVKAKVARPKFVMGGIKPRGQSTSSAAASTPVAAPSSPAPAPVVPSSPAPTAPSSPPPAALATPAPSSKPVFKMGHSSVKKSLIFTLQVPDLVKARPKQDSYEPLDSPQRAANENGIAERRMALRQALADEPINDHNGAPHEHAADDNADHVGGFTITHHPTHAVVTYQGHPVIEAIHGPDGKRSKRGPTGKEILKRVRQAQETLHGQAASQPTGKRFVNLFKEAFKGKPAVSDEELSSFMEQHSRLPGEGRGAQNVYSAMPYVNQHLFDRMFTDEGLHGVHLKADPNSPGRYTVHKVATKAEAPAAQPAPAPAPSQPSVSASAQGAPAQPAAPQPAQPQQAPSAQGPNSLEAAPLPSSGRTLRPPDPKTALTIDPAKLKELAEGLVPKAGASAEDDGPEPPDGAGPDDAPEAVAAAPAVAPAPAKAPAAPAVPAPTAPAPSAGTDEEGDAPPGDDDAGPEDALEDTRKYHQMRFHEFQDLFKDPTRGAQLRHDVEKGIPQLDDDPAVKQHSGKMAEHEATLKKYGIKLQGGSYLGRAPTQAENPEGHAEVMQAERGMKEALLGRREARARAAHKHFINQAFSQFKDDEIHPEALNDHGMQHPGQVVKIDVDDPLERPTAPVKPAAGKTAPTAGSQLGFLTRPRAPTSDIAPPKNTPMPSTAPHRPPAQAAAAPAAPAAPTTLPTTKPVAQFRYDAGGQPTSDKSKPAHVYSVHEADALGHMGLVHHDAGAKTTKLVGYVNKNTSPNYGAQLHQMKDQHLASMKAAAPVPKKGLFSRLFGKSEGLYLDTAKVQMISQLAKAEGDMPKHDAKVVTRSGKIKHDYAKLSRRTASVRPDAGEADPAQFATHLRTTSGVLSKIARASATDADFVRTIRKNAPAVVRKHAVTDEYLKSLYRALKARAA